MNNLQSVLTQQSRFERYEDWQRWAQEDDRRKGLQRWRDNEVSDLYDHQIIRRRYDELVDARASGEPERLFYYFNEGLHGNMGGMGDPQLYSKAKSGTKSLIGRYIDEIVAALQQLDETRIRVPKIRIEP